MEPHILSMLYGIDEENLYPLVEDAKDYAMYKGIAMRVPDLPHEARVPLPFCLVPSQYPKKNFDFANELQPHLNFVLFKIAHDKTILKECLSSTIEADEFIANIFKIFEAVDREGNSQQLSLGLIRSDYLLDSDSSGRIKGIKQVENNTIASSFGGVSPSVRDLHEYVLERLGRKSFDQKLPMNESVHELAKGILGAWDMYDNPSAIILFIVEEITLNICDQRAMEYAILSFESNVEVLRSTFKELRTSVKLKGKKLFVGEKEVAVVYYRVGYAPEHYELQDWETRFLMERSCAIKCPSAGLQLAGTKRVQTYLTRPGVLESFVGPPLAQNIREVFAKQYTLDVGENGDAAIALGIKNPEKYVLKPEREGGGNNIYGNDVKIKLENIKSTDERNAYILMEQICPPESANCIVQRDKIPTIHNVICELGIFGVILGNKDDIHINCSAGHLIRSKEAHSNEGGIVAGFGALDSPYLE